jgi:hypothetical protein
MAPEQRKLLTIVTEAALEHELVRDLERLGAHGYTITDARGKGSRGIRDAGWDLSANIRLEVICTADTAHAIAVALREHYYANYAMILFIGDVEVLRPEKF